MTNSKQPELSISGVGVVTAIGQGREALTQALLAGQSQFAVMQREGRQAPAEQPPTAFMGAELEALVMPERVSKRDWRSASLSAQAALVCLEEAWLDAQLQQVAPNRIGLIVGGSNLQQRELSNTQRRYQDKAAFIRPNHAVSFMDTDICGLLSEQFGILGPCYSLGAASASGQAAVIQAAHAVASGQVDVCIALGGLMDLSHWECQAFRSLGAMGSDRFAEQPNLACRPFDEQRDGFIYGEMSGAIVIESQQSMRQRGLPGYAHLRGYAQVMDANRNPNPSYEGECQAIAAALAQAGLQAADIDYVNPHGTGSPLGDETELKALADSGLRHARINATKSLLGHGLSAAGNVELIVTLLQMRAGQLHPCGNLEQPIDADFGWVQTTAQTHQIQQALSLSMGFGGINTAVCLQAC